MKKIHKIAVTGGPSAGKSTLLREVDHRLSGEIVTVPEVATMLLSDPWQRWLLEENTSAWHRSRARKHFQERIAYNQQILEFQADDRARDDARGVIVCDRGILDGAAYMKQGVRRLASITKESEAEMLNRYDTVIHLASSAIYGSYDKTSNPYRIEEAEEALEIERRTLDVWQNHPNRLILDNPDKHQRVMQGLVHIMQIVDARH